MKLPTEDLEQILLTKKERAVLAFWRANPRATVQETANALKVADRTVYRTLKRAFKLRFLKTSDSPKARKRGALPANAGDFPPEFFAYVYYWNAYPNLFSVEVCQLVGIKDAVGFRFNALAHSTGLTQETAMERQSRLKKTRNKAHSYYRCPLRGLDGKFLEDPLKYHKKPTRRDNETPRDVL